MTAPPDMGGVALDRAARLEAAALDLLVLRDDPSFATYRAAAVGGTVPFLPGIATLAAAASTLDQVARVLRWAAQDTVRPRAGTAP